MAMLSTDAPQIIEHASLSLGFSPFDCKWIPCSSKFVAMGQLPRGTGGLNIYEITSSETKLAKQIELPSGIKCGTFGASSLEDRHLAVGDFAGRLSIIDLEKPEVPLFQAKAHSSTLNCIDGCGGLGIGGGAPEILTGGRDGIVKLWDPRVKEAVLALEPSGAAAPGAATEGAAAAGAGAGGIASTAGLPIASRDCWGVAFGNSFNDHERVIAAGYDNGDVKIFDLRKQSMVWEGNAGNGVTSLEFDRKDIEMNKLLLTCLEARFKVQDMRVHHPREGYATVTEKAHKATVWLGKHLPQNRELFMTTGGNGGLNIYRYHYPAVRVKKDADGVPMGQPGTCELLNARIVSSQPIVGFDWNADMQGLACSVSLDQTARVFLVTKLNKY